MLGWEGRPAWMARAYSMDLRNRVAAAVLRESRHAVARRFDLDPSCVVKWMPRLANTGSVAPKQIGRYRHRNRFRAALYRSKTPTAASLPDQHIMTSPAKIET